MTAPSMSRLLWCAVAGLGVLALAFAVALLASGGQATVMALDEPRPRPIVASSSPQLNCLIAPSVCGFPDATTTGVPPGLKLTVVEGDMHTTRDGQVIERLDIRGTLYIDHSSVTVQNTKVTGAGGYSWAIWVGKDDPVVDVVIRDCTVDANQSDQGGVTSGAALSWTMRRCDISNGENAIRPGGNALIEDNYLHDFASSSPAPHYDAVEVYSGANTRLVHNTMILNRGHTSVVNVQAAFGPIEGTVVERNLIQGGGWQLNVRSLDGPVTNTSITNNRFGDESAYGYAALDPGTVSVLRGNVRDTTGASIDREF